MICPNCGLDLPDMAHVCPRCSAVQRGNKRRRADVDRPEETVRVARRVVPAEQPVHPSPKREGRQGTASSPTHSGRSRREVAGGSRAGDEMAYQTIPRATPNRPVRHAQSRMTRKLDAAPVMMNPQIYRKSHKSVLRVIAIVLVMTVVIVSVVGYMFVETERGQLLMATWDWPVADTWAYISLGQELLDQAYPSRALEKLNVVRTREPQNVEALILIAQAYTELNQTDEAVEIYQSLIETIAPEHPSAYRNLIKIYQKEGYNAEALSLMRLASEKVNMPQEFGVMLREFTPESPRLSPAGGKFTENMNVTISIPEGLTVYYTIDGTDPSESGMVYKEGTEIPVTEGKLTVKAIAFAENGTPSDQVTGTYTVTIPTPAAPKANYQPGVYKRAPKISLRPGSEDKKENAKIVAIYYTLDGRQATTSSTLYTGPIQLPIGDTRLRAIAVSSDGKVSYEMNNTYKVEGNLKNMFGSKDTFKNMELFKTGYNTFVKAWGTPLSYEVLPKEQWYSEDMESYEAVYNWGTARMCIKTKGGNPVLYALDTTNAKMSAPRSTKVGMHGDEVMGKFRDLGQAALDASGSRLLYNYNSANVQFGTYRMEANGLYAIHYYYPINEKQDCFVELSYYLDADGNVSRIVWERYLAQDSSESGN